MIFSIFDRKGKEPKTGLEHGWQFYARPTTLEPVGHVFRIDEDGVRFPVGSFPVATEEGVEAGSSGTERMELKVGILARFLDLIDLGANVSASHARVLHYEIHDPIRILSTDLAMEAALKNFLRSLEPKRGSRYFVIRQTRSASSVVFKLSADFAAELGGEGTISAGLKAGARLNIDRAGNYEIHQSFPQRLLVMFQPDRIERVAAGLAEEGAFGLVPAVEMLEWREPGGG